MLDKLIEGKVNISQCQELAKKFGHNKVTFDMCGPTGRVKCKWLDAYLGLFEAESDPGKFIRVKDVLFCQDIWCENIIP